MGLESELLLVRLDPIPRAERYEKPQRACRRCGDYSSALVAAAPFNRARASRAAICAQSSVACEGLRRRPQRDFFSDAIACRSNGIFVDEVTQVGFASRLAFPVLAPKKYFSPGYQDTLGWGYGAALGVKSARPDLPVLAIAGDGGFMYQIGELATAVQHDIAVVVVVFDNHGSECSPHPIGVGRRPDIACDLEKPDFVSVASRRAVRSATSPLELQAR